MAPSACVYACVRVRECVAVSNAARNDCMVGTLFRRYVHQSRKCNYELILYLLWPTLDEDIHCCMFVPNALVEAKMKN